MKKKLAAFILTLVIIVSFSVVAFGGIPYLGPFDCDPDSGRATIEIDPPNPNPTE